MIPPLISSFVVLICILTQVSMYYLSLLLVRILHSVFLSKGIRMHMYKTNHLRFTRHVIGTVPTG